jgi:hypothetical protein
MAQSSPSKWGDGWHAAPSPAVVMDGLSGLLSRHAAPADRHIEGQVCSLSSSAEVHVVKSSGRGAMLNFVEVDASERGASSCMSVALGAVRLRNW